MSGIRMGVMACIRNVMQVLQINHWREGYFLHAPQVCRVENCFRQTSDQMISCNRGPFLVRPRIANVFFFWLVVLDFYTIAWCLLPLCDSVTVRVFDGKKLEVERLEVVNVNIKFSVHTKLPQPSTVSCLLA